MTGALFTVPLRRLRGRNGLVLGGAATIVAALSVNRLFAGQFLDAVGGEVSDAGVVAVAMTAAATFRCLWHWRCPVLRPLGATFAVVTAYQIVVLVSYEPSSGAWGAFGAVLWPSIPLAYAAWGSAALAIARVARGVEIGLASDWQRYRLRGALFTRSWMPRPAHLWLWLPAIVFSGLSLVPGVVYSGRAVPGVTWHGQPYQPHVVYGVISVWGIATLIGSALIAEHAWQTKRSALGASDRFLVRGAVVVSFVAVVCAFVLAASAVTGFWPEPVIDLLLALYAVIYTLGFTARDARTSAPTLWPSREYVLENALVIAFSLLLAFTTTHSPALRGLEAVAFTSLLTLIILSVKHVRDRVPERDDTVVDPGTAVRETGLERFSSAEHERLRGLLAGTTTRTLRLYVTSLPLEGLSGVEPSGLNELDRARLKAFTSALAGELGDEAAYRVLRLFYEIARVLPDRPTARRPLDPSPMFVVRAQCHRRAPVTSDKGELEQLRIDELRFRLFSKSEPKRADALPRYRFHGQIAKMTEDELIEALEILKGRQAGRPKQALRELLEAGLGEVRDALLVELP